MRDYYVNLFEYNDWANKLILKTTTENNVRNQKIFSLFSHIIIAQILWLNRINNETYEFRDFWQMLTPEEMGKLSIRSTSEWKFIIRNGEEKDLEKEVSYINSKGIFYKNTVAQIITHVINHSSYHRGQIASLFRVENINPPLTDYIAFFR